MKKLDRSKLSDAHRRGITTTLAFLDELLCDVEQWASGREIHSVLYHESNAFTPAQKHAMLSQIEKLRRVLSELAQTLELEPHRNDGSREIWGRCLGFLEHLEELQGKHMQRYGKPPDWLGEYLDPRAEELINGVGKIAQVAAAAQKQASKRLPADRPHE